MAGLAAHLKLKRHLFKLRIGGHDTLRRHLATVGRKSPYKLGNTRLDGINGHLLTDNARGRYHNVLGGNVESLTKQSAGGLSYLDAVCVAGVGVAAVADYRLSVSVCNIALCNRQGRALYQILRIDRRCRATLLTPDESNVPLGLVLSDAAMDTACQKSFCGTNAAVYLLHFILPN